MFYGLLANPVFWSIFFALMIAQLIKPIVSLICGNGWNPKLIFTNGGMPSSHTSTVTALATSVGFYEGFDSTSFIICLVLAFIVMNDAFNVRLETGKQAEALNEWATVFSEMFQDGVFSRKKFKTMVGHTVLQVFWGMVVGVCTGIIIHLIYFYYG